MKMNKEIIVLPKFAFDNSLIKNEITIDNVETLTKAAFISIIGADKNEDKHYFPTNKSNVLNMKFDDIDDDVFVDGEIVGHCFNEGDAMMLIAFLLRNKDKSTFIVHCAAGVSRSGAIGTFINDFFQSDYKEFKLANPHILPNGKVLQVLNRYVRKEANEAYINKKMNENN